MWDYNEITCFSQLAWLARLFLTTEMGDREGVTSPPPPMAEVTRGAAAEGRSVIWALTKKWGWWKLSERWKLLFLLGGKPPATPPILGGGGGGGGGGATADPRLLVICCSWACLFLRLETVWATKRQGCELDGLGGSGSFPMEWVRP